MPDKSMGGSTPRATMLAGTSRRRAAGSRLGMYPRNAETLQRGCNTVGRES
jgi:hypothetical protein